MSAFEVFRGDVAFHVETGRAEADLEKLRREAHAAYGGMSDDSLKLAAAQERYDRTLAKHGPLSRQARDAEIRYRAEVERSTRSTRENTVALDRQERELSQVTRGAVAGTGVLRGYARSVGFLSASFLGSAGLVYALRSTLNAAKESQVVLGQTENAVKRAGLSWSEYGDQIQKAALAQANISGFDDERLLRTFSTFVRRTKDVNEALHLNAIAADVARGRNIELEQAANLVLKASIGQAGALRRLGIDAHKGATAVQLLALLQQRYAGSAEAYGKTAQGAQDRFNVALQNTQELIGTALLPTVTKYLDKGATWLSDTKNQARIQRDVNAVVEDATKIMHGFAKAVDAVDGPIEAVVGALGGLENAAQTALIVGVLLKARKAAAGFGLIEAASTRTRNVIVANAGAEVRALNTVTAAEARVAGAAVGGGALAALGRRGAGFVGGAAEIAVLIAAVDILTGEHKTQPHGLNRYSGSKGWPNLANDIAGIFGADWQHAGLPQITAPVPERVAPRAGDDPLEGLSASLRAAFSPSKLAAGGVVPPLNAAQQRAVNLARYTGTGGPAEVAALRAQADYDRRALAFLEEQKRAGKVTNARYVEAYSNLYGDLSAREDAIAAIDAKADAATEKRQADAKAAQKKRDAAAKKAAPGIARAALRGADLGALGVRGGALAVAGGLIVPGDVAAAAARAQARIPKAGLGVKGGFLVGITSGELPERFALEERIAAASVNGEKKLNAILRRELAALREQEQILRLGHAKRLDILKVQAAIAETRQRLRGSTAETAGTGFANREQFLSSFQQIVGAYAPNAFPLGARGGGGGKSETHLYEAVHELRAQTNVLHRIAGHEAFPATRQAVSTALAAFG